MSRSRVLCVDDEPKVLEGLTVSLGRRFEVVTCCSGTAGLGVVEKDGPFDVVVSDMQMPGMNGVEFLRRARTLAPEMARILLTGQASLECAVSAVNEGHVQRFLTKPCPPENLIAALVEVIDSRRQAIAARLELESKIQGLSRQLLQADRLATLGVLAHAVGHELSNLTMVCVGTVQLMEERASAGLPPEQRQMDTLKRVGGHLKAHSSHLLRLGRPSPSVREIFDLRSAVSDVLAALQVTGRTGYITLELQDSGSPALVCATRMEIEQVLINLIANAVDALGESSDKNGVVRIHVETDEPHAQVICRVQDNGCGIPQDKLDEVFQTYYTTKPPDRGTGLGLAIVKQIVEAHHGSITVQSRPGEGTTFTVYIPVTKDLLEVAVGH